MPLNKVRIPLEGALILMACEGIPTVGSTRSWAFYISDGVHMSHNISRIEQEPASPIRRYRLVAQEGYKALPLGTVLTVQKRIRELVRDGLASVVQVIPAHTQL